METKETVKHTPGPWKVNSDAYETLDEHGNELIGFDIDSESAKITALATVWGSSEKHKATAHLVASAPELLEALEEQLKYISLITPEAQEAFQKSKSAINKAKGL